MLGNNADAFFTTPMPTTILRGGNKAHQYRNEMPAPFVTGSKTMQYSMLPGVGQDPDSPVTATAPDVAAPAPASSTLLAASPKPINWMLWAGVAIGGLAMFGAFNRPR